MNWLFVGLLMCAASVAAGAFGAHGLRSALDAGHLALWETAARYLMYGGVVVVLLGLAARGRTSTCGSPAGCCSLAP